MLLSSFWAAHCHKPFLYINGQCFALLSLSLFLYLWPNQTGHGQVKISLIAIYRFDLRFTLAFFLENDVSQVSSHTIYENITGVLFTFLSNVELFGFSSNNSAFKEQSGSSLNTFPTQKLSNIFWNSKQDTKAKICTKLYTTFKVSFENKQLGIAFGVKTWSLFQNIKK